MKVLKASVALLSLLIFFTSCSEDDDYYTPPPSGVEENKTTFDGLTEEQKEVVNYFSAIALGFEYGNESLVTRKWKSEMKVFVSGELSDELDDEFKAIVTELNGMFTDGFNIELVENKEESNYHVFIGTAESYASQYPDVAALVDENWGLFSLFWDEDENLTGGHMYVDNVRPGIAGQKHLLREEFTQSLGLAKDATTYTNSIFQSAWTTTNAYADIDKELIKLLYHPSVTSGLTKSEVESVLVKILSDE